MDLPKPGEEHYPFYTIGEKEYCDNEIALGLMLMKDYIFAGSSEAGGPFLGSDKTDKTGTTSLWVNCNDLFYWGTADCEDLPLGEIGALYKSILEHGSTLNWCCKKRGVRPQIPIVKRLKDSGKWTPELEALPAPEPS